MSVILTPSAIPRRESYRYGPIVPTFHTPTCHDNRTTSLIPLELDDDSTLLDDDVQLKIVSDHIEKLVVQCDSTEQGLVNLALVSSNLKDIHMTQTSRLDQQNELIMTQTSRLDQQNELIMTQTSRLDQQNESIMVQQSSNLSIEARLDELEVSMSVYWKDGYQAQLFKGLLLFIVPLVCFLIGIAFQTIPPL